MRRSNILAFLILLCAVPAHAQLFGPTTRTPRLTVFPGPTTVEALTVNGALSATAGIGADFDTIRAPFAELGDLLVTTCTGCGTAITTTQIDTTLTDGCSNDPAISFLATHPVVTGVGSVVTIIKLSASDVSCTSDGTNLGTLSGAIPAAIRPSVTQYMKYTPVRIAGVETDVCIRITSTGTLTFMQGVTCQTALGNVAKVVTEGIQNALTYVLQ